MVQNPLHGVESYLPRADAVAQPCLNPLHGVESYNSNNVHDWAFENPLHGVERVLQRYYRGNTVGGNPLHGVERGSETVPSHG